MPHKIISAIGIYGIVAGIVMRMWTNFTRRVPQWTQQDRHDHPFAIIDQILIDVDPNLIIQELRANIIRVPLEDQVDMDPDDKQNVHNKTIKRMAVMAINALQKSNLNRYSIKSAFDEINDYLTTNPENFDQNLINNAINALNIINNMDSLYLTANIREREVVKLIWERINHPINTPNLKLLQENFVQELSDCYKGNNSVYCCEGRIVRLLQSLQQCDQERIVDLRPLWAFKEEIINKITKYQNKLLKKVPIKYSLAYQKPEPTPEDKELIKDFTLCLINNLNRRFEIDYIKPKYLTKNELQDLTSVYYQSLMEF